MSLGTKEKEKKKRKKKKKKKKKKPDRIANLGKKEKKKSKVKSCGLVLFVGLLCVFNYNIVIELWVMETEKQPKVIFSFYNS